MSGMLEAFYLTSQIPEPRQHHLGQCCQHNKEVKRLRDFNGIASSPANDTVCQRRDNFMPSSRRAFQIIICQFIDQSIIAELDNEGNRHLLLQDITDLQKD
jgi:hypothetical protein